MPSYKLFLEDGGEIREGLTCAYCKLVLKDPVQTSESGLRFCRGCFEEAIKDPSWAGQLDPNDEVWLDRAVQKQISNLKVKCDNYKAGCDWKGLFKRLMKTSIDVLPSKNQALCEHCTHQHTQECHYATVDCSCGRQVLLNNMELHFNKECSQRQVYCNDCGEAMSYNELLSHGAVCPNAVRMCSNCDKKFPAHQLVNHMIRECKHVRCVCREGRLFERNDKNFDVHLQDPDKLSEHLKPIISYFPKVAEMVQELSRRVTILERQSKVHEKRGKQANERFEYLEMKVTKYEASNQVLKEKVEALEKENACLAQLVYQNHHCWFRQIDQSLQKLDEELQKLKTETSQIATQLEGVNTAVTSAKTELLDKPSIDFIKQVEGKVLELETILNAIGATRNSDIMLISELDLQLQTALACIQHGKIIWRIPEVHQRIREAKMGRITYIDSPPFYTGRNGYKMCIRAYLNGDGSGEGTHLSIFFVLMKGEYDPLLQWPFEPKVSLILVDQDHMKHLVQSFKPNPQSSSFQQPKTDMNVASGCPEFADLSILDNTSYVKDNVMYIKSVVDISTVRHL